MSKNVNILKSSKHVTPENMELVSLKDYRGLETEFNKALARIDFLDHTIDAMNNEIAELCPKGQSLIESIADKEKQLSEARAEIERLKSEHEDSLRRAKDNAVSLSGAVTEYANELLAKDKQLAEARAALETAESEIRGAIKLCGEYAISAKEGLHASLALSIGRLKYQLECELAHKKKLSDCANSGIITNESLFGRLAEARAEIERLEKQNLDRASATLWAIMRHAFMDGAFKGYQHGTEERLRVQYFNEWCQKNYPEAVGEAIAQMRLIEQMGEALKLADDLIDEYAADYEHRDNVDEIREEIKAALAAERVKK